MRKVIKKNKLLVIVIVIVLIIETGLDFGALSYSDSVYGGSNAKLSPVLMCPNGLSDDVFESENKIRFSLLEKLENILEGRDARDLSCKDLISIIREDSLKNTVYQQMNPDLPWIFINEVFERSGDIIVKCRMIEKGVIQTFFAIFGLEKDPEGGFIIKGIYTEDDFRYIDFTTEGRSFDKIYYDINVFVDTWFDEEIPRIAESSDDKVPIAFQKSIRRIFLKHFPDSDIGLEGNNELWSGLSAFYDRYCKDKTSTRFSLLRLHEIYLKYNSLIKEVNERISANPVFPDIRFKRLKFVFDAFEIPLRNEDTMDPSNMTLTVNAGYLFDDGKDIFGIGTVAREAGYGSVGYVSSRAPFKNSVIKEEVISNWAAAHILTREEISILIKEQAQNRMLRRNDGIKKHHAAHLSVLAERNGIENTLETLENFSSDLKNDHSVLYDGLTWQKEPVESLSGKAALEISGTVRLENKQKPGITGIWNIISSHIVKVMFIIIAAIVISLGSGSRSSAALSGSAGHDFTGVANSFLQRIDPETINTYMRISQELAIDIKTLMSVEMTEVNYKGVVEIRDEKDAKRMTSKKGAVGAWQLMPQSAKYVNEYIDLINEKIKVKEYVSVVDRRKMEIIKEMGFKDGIELRKIDHNDPLYEADYNRRAAALILAINRYSMDRLKLVKKDKSKKWHFEIRGPNEKHGFDLEKIIILTHNLSMSGVKQALREGGPEKYWDYLPGETKVFFNKIRSYREVLEDEPHSGKFNAVIYEALNRETGTVDKAVSKEDNSFIAGIRGLYKKATHLLMGVDVLEVMFLGFFICCFSGVSLYLLRIRQWVRNTRSEAGRGFKDFVKSRLKENTRTEETDIFPLRPISDVGGDEQLPISFAGKKEIRDKQTRSVSPIFERGLGQDLMASSWHGTSSVSWPDILKRGALHSKKALEELGLIDLGAMEYNPINEKGVSFAKGSSISYAVSWAEPKRDWIPSEKLEEMAGLFRNTLRDIKLEQEHIDRLETRIAGIERKLRVMSSMSEIEIDILRDRFEDQFPMLIGVVSKNDLVDLNEEEQLTRDNLRGFNFKKDGNRVTFIAVPEERIKEIEEQIRHAGKAGWLSSSEAEDIISGRIVSIDQVENYGVLLESLLSEVLGDEPHEIWKKSTGVQTDGSLVEEVHAVLKPFAEKQGSPVSVVEIPKKEIQIGYEKPSNINSTVVSEPKGDIRDMSVTETYSDFSSTVKNIGVTLSPPVEKYTLYVSMGFCSVKEFETDKFKYGSRFDLSLIRKDNAEKIAEYVMSDVSERGIDPGNVVVQLPYISERDEAISSLREMSEMGIRFITLDTEGLKSSFPEEKEKEIYRENIYAVMLLVRKVSGDSNDPILISLLRSLVGKYTADKEEKEAMFREYLKAMIRGDVSEIIKTVLVYKPSEKLVDDLSNRWDSKTLIFA